MPKKKRHFYTPLRGPKRPAKGKKGARRGRSKTPFWANILSSLIIFFVLISAYTLIVENENAVEEIAISELAIKITNEEVSSITVRGSKLEILLKDETEFLSKKEDGVSLTETLTAYGVSVEMLSSVKMEIKNPNGFGFWALNLAPFLIPLLFIGFFIWMLTRQVKGAGAQAFTFGQSKARFIDPKDKGKKVTFKDVAGAKEAKEELLEIVDFLKSPKKFLDIGASIPKGVILMGLPGTGKTLLAKAVAGEANVPFYSISGSEFMEMFVGVGASRVRDLFLTAKKTAPSIIFIDEIDAVGRVRGTGVGGGNDEREQTLNQILVEMDGFETNGKVIVIAATNRADVLDPALLRPGRFDRRVYIDLPDRDGREKILEIHSRGKQFGEDIDLKVIAERTPGLSGADLQSLMNEGAILAARENRKKIAQFDLVRSIEKVLLGPERKSHVLSEREKELTAYHEAGHALVASLLPNADPVHKISIIARGHAGGYTLSLPDEEQRLKSRNDFLDIIAMSMGGFAAEMIVYGDITTGPSNDLQVATSLARDMVTKYGMSDDLGPLAFEGAKMGVINGQMFGKREYSQEVSAKIDGEVTRIMKEAESKARELLLANRKVLDIIVSTLLEKENIERDEFEQILIANGVKINKKEKIDIKEESINN